MATMTIPTDEADLCAAIAEAIRAGDRLMIGGGLTKSDIGRPVKARALSTAGIRGIVDYDPAELVLTVRPGTLLTDVEALIAGERQMLAFEPYDHAPIFGRAAGNATIGGVVAAGVAGSRRVSAGGARDHLLGLRAVSGRGEMFVAGAKVVKNVTGYDIPKLATGSWGRLFALTELTLKVLPRPETSVTRFVSGLDAHTAVIAMAAAMGSQAAVAAAAHRPQSSGEPAITALRLEGFGSSVRARGVMLDALLSRYGMIDIAGEQEAAAFWAGVQTLSLLPQARTLWRVNVAPSKAAAFVEGLAALQPDWLMDWAGGLVWIAMDDAADAVRAAAAQAGGHATLIRADEPTRRAIPALPPLDRGLAALEERVRRAFDPAGIFETERF
jgi:glycolate oxidase FAD binding subunit